ncbi:MAG TPA: low molecular weight phosphotyrosine protein phosphatase [Prosthecochloris aestuarii]|uniref:protein-tyrosine-phosphatase n=1 Tax=Prosthecochloris aestuarii TaxID=1102 RepID=A0A831WSS9_PROAE|nr:low molecular weight phosphotyrosine protein phosphatase [Prosthecochloris aestuarii]
MVQSVLFVCYENICRSPMAEGIFRYMVEQRGLQHCFSISSAGTVDYQSGSPPDERAVEVSVSGGIDISSQRGGIAHLDLLSYDWIFVMDNRNYEDVLSLFPAGTVPPVYMVTHFLPDGAGREIHDPYYGGVSDFEHVFQELCHALGYVTDIVSGGA